MAVVVPHYANKHTKINWNGKHWFSIVCANTTPTGIITILCVCFRFYQQHRRRRVSLQQDAGAQGDFWRGRRRLQRHFHPGGQPPASLQNTSSK
jgi:hypothetical protein